MAEPIERRDPVSREAHERMMHQVAELAATKVLNNLSPHDLTTKTGIEAHRADAGFIHQWRVRCEWIHESAFKAFAKWGGVSAALVLLVYFRKEIPIVDSVLNMVWK